MTCYDECGRKGGQRPGDNVVAWKMGIMCRGRQPNERLAIRKQRTSQALEGRVGSSRGKEKRLVVFAFRTRRVSGHLETRTTVLSLRDT